MAHPQTPEEVSLFKWIDDNYGPVHGVPIKLAAREIFAAIKRKVQLDEVQLVYYKKKSVFLDYQIECAKVRDEFMRKQAEKQRVREERVKKDTEFFQWDKEQAEKMSCEKEEKPRQGRRQEDT